MSGFVCKGLTGCQPHFTPNPIRMDDPNVDEKSESEPEEEPAFDLVLIHDDSGDHDDQPGVWRDATGCTLLEERQIRQRMGLSLDHL